MSTYELLLLIAMLALIVAFFITLLRFIYGPSFVDRLITFDLMTANLIGVIGIYAMLSKQPVLMDVALVFALISFFSILVFAYYLKNKRRDERNS